MGSFARALVTGRLAGWFVLLTALVVSLSTAAAITALRNYAEERRDAQLLIAQIEADARSVSQAQHHAPDEPAGDTHEVVLEEEWRIRDAVQRLQQLDGPGGASLPVSTALDAWAAQGVVQRRLIEAGDLVAARDLHTELIEPTFDHLLTAIENARESYRSSAALWSRIADLGTGLSFVAGGTVIGLLFRRFERTRRMAAEMAGERKGLRESEERFRSLVQNSSDAILVVAPDWTVRYDSPSVEGLLGYEPGSLLGRKLVDFLHPEDRARGIVFLAEALSQPGVTAPIEWRLRRRDAAWLTAESVASNLVNDPNWQGIILNSRDISDRKLLEEQLKHQALHDPLTDLPNRALFTDRVEHALIRANRRAGQIAVLFLDLDNFKTTNDSMGHAAGDQLLLGVAQRLRAALRASDTAARLGGDEFAVLLEDVGHVRGAIRAAERIIKALDHPFKVMDKSVVVGASIGVAVSTAGQEEADELLRNADLAMYVAKAHGKGRYELFKSSMHTAVVERARMEADLQRAVDAEEFVVHYQPIVALGSGAIVGLEALVRWQHPERGTIAAASFVPLAEEMGLIIPIGRRVLAEAVQQGKRWEQQYGAVRYPSVSVNLSAREFEQRGLVREIEAALTESQLDPRHLILELTESAVMNDVDPSIVKLRELKDLGVRIALDDFGTGYSSLGYLQRFPIDFLKIDKSLIDGLGVRPEAPPLVAAIVTLARTMEVQAVAEGVERADQLEALRRIGCDLGQGQHFSMAIPADAVGSLLIAPYTTALTLGEERRPSRG